MDYFAICPNCQRRQGWDGHAYGPCSRRVIGTYSDGSRVEIVGRRNGFAYITFLDGPNVGTTTKVPTSWVGQDY